jgi:hypothetical protein
MRDESYEAGYRAGHLQGWLDAMAKQEASQRMAAGPDRPAAAPPSAWQATPARPADTSVPSADARPEPLSGTASPRRVETPAEQQARREKRDRQNINITLYVASLLLVAAAALFIGTNLPPMFRFVGVCAVTAAFYAAGFVLYARVPRLRPAAVAFAGTGLAMVPVTGLALYNFALHHGPAAWLITSLIGTAAYVMAAVRLESRVLVYLSLTFVASTACSGVSVLGGALVWYFAALIGVAVLLTVLAMARPGWLPPIYVRPLMALHPFVVPAVAIAATCVPLLLAKSEYALIIGMCGAYFVLTAAAPGRLRLVNFYAARITLTVAAAVAIWDLTGRGHDALLAVAGLLAVQAMTVAFVQARLSNWFPKSGRRTGTPQNRAKAPMDRGRWPLDALVTFGAQLAATVAFAVHVIFSDFYSNAGVEAGSAVPLWVPVLLALATGMVLAGRIAGPAEWAPAAALTLAGLLGVSMGAWPLAGMLVLASAFWAVRGILTAGALRGQMVLAARAAITLAVPVTVAAVADDGPGRAAAAGFGLLVALVCQQMVSAVLQRFAVRTLAPEASLGAFAAAGAVTLIVLPFLDTAPDNGLTGPAVLVQLLAALAIGLLLVPRPDTERDWHATVWEALPLGLSAVAVTVAFQAVSQGAGNGALLLVAGYLFATARRLRLRQHRWTYWWLGRGTATVLVLTAFDQLQQDSGPTVIGDELLYPATVLITSLALQLVFPLLAAARRRAPRWILADAGAVLLLQLSGCAILAPLEAATWQGTYAAVVVALGAAATGYFLRAEAGSEWFAPVAFGALLVFTDGELAEVELLLAIFAVFCAVMVVAAPQPVRKGWYFVAARVLTAGLAVVLSYDITTSPTVVSLTFALVLAAQHAVRWAMRSRLADIPFQQAAVWITLAGQALLPLAYVLQPASTGVLEQDDDGGRWVVLLELFLLLVSAVVARKFFTARGALYFGVYAALFGVLSLGPLFSFGGRFLAAPVLDNTGTAAVLLSIALAAAAAGALLREQNVSVRGIDHWLWLGTAASFSLAGLLVSPWAAEWVVGAAVLVLSAVCFTASHVEGQPFLYPPAAAAGLAGSNALAEAAFQDIPGVWDGFLPWLAGAGLAAAALYSLRFYRRQQLLDDPVRRWSLAGAAFLGLCLVALAGVRHDETSWLAAAVLAAAVVIPFLEVPPRARRIAAELGALALTAAVQRAAIFSLDGDDYGYPVSDGLPDPFWVVQWYVLLAAGLGALRYASGHQLAGRLMVGAAAGLLSLSGLGVVFGGTDGQQLWVLVLLAGLLLVGLGLGDRLFVWWGAAGVAICILWAMRQYTFALLALIAAGLIVFAVWRLNRGPATELPDAHPTPDGPAPDGSWSDGSETGSSGSHQPVPHQPVPHQPGGPDPFSRP